MTDDGTDPGSEPCSTSCATRSVTTGSFIADLVATYVGGGRRPPGGDGAGGARPATPAAIVRPAHTLKSSSAALGAMRLAQIAREIEMAGRAGDDGLASRSASSTRCRRGTRRSSEMVGSRTDQVTDDLRPDRRRQRGQRQLLARHLRSIGIEAREATDGRRALERCCGELGGQVGVVLLDVVMPEMDGYETLAAIKADEALRHVPVIMISGVDELDSVVRCIQLGATDYLPKPFNPTILAARVRASMADKRMRDLEVEHAARPGRAARHDRAPEGGAQPLPVAAGRGARVDPRGSGVAGRPPARGDGRLLRPARLHRLQRSGRAGGGARSAARVPRPDGRAHRRARRHARALRRRRDDGLLQRPGAPAGSRRTRRAHGRGDARRCLRRLAAKWARLGFELGLGVGIATGYATLGRIGFEGRYDYGMVGTAVIVASRLSSAAEANQILLNPRAHAAVEELVDVEEVGALSLKGFARPIPTVNVVALRSAVAA